MNKATFTFLNRYKLLLIVFLSSVILFRFAYVFQNDFHRVMDVATFLTWHNLFELTSIIVSFAVFLVSYYTYEQTRSFNSIFIGCIFLFCGIIDIFHMLSYKGMPEFLVSNMCCANRATTLYMVSRLVQAIGFAVASFILPYRTLKVNKLFFSIPATLLTLLVLIVTTYYPSLLPAMYLEPQGLTWIKTFLEYVCIGFFTVAGIKVLHNNRRNESRFNILLCAALIFNIFSDLAFTSYGAVYDIYNYLGHIYKFIASFIIFAVMFKHDIKKPYGALKSAQVKLKNYADNLDKLVEQRTSELKQLNRKLLNDLEYARDIQKAMLPLRLPNEHNVRFSDRYFPAERVSGDFYNIMKLADGNIVFYIGDVSGHGVPAAMLTVFLRQNIGSITELQFNENGVILPSLVLRALYSSFNNTNFKDEVYSVLIYAAYNPDTMELTYSSAGLNTQPFRVSISGGIDEFQAKGFPICKFNEFYSAQYSNAIIKLNHGDKVIFYTDGLTEAQNEYEKQFTDERLKSLVKNNYYTSAHELSGIIEKEIFEFMGSCKLRDDITFFIMEVD